MASLVPTVRTSLSMAQVGQAAAKAYRELTGLDPSAETLAVIWGQVAQETGGGQSLFNFNLGNMKHGTSDGFDFMALKGVWEGVSPEEAERLIASGEAHEDNDEGHVVGPGKVSVVFEPPHPATLFRAYPNESTGAKEYLRRLRDRFTQAWPFLEQGNPDEFVKALKRQGYFTGDLDSYLRGVRRNFDLFLGQTPASPFPTPGSPNPVLSATGARNTLASLAFVGALSAGGLLALRAIGNTAFVKKRIS